MFVYLQPRNLVNGKSTPSLTIEEEEEEEMQQQKEEEEMVEQCQLYAARLIENFVNVGIKS